MIWRFLVSKVGLFVTLVWIADLLSVPIPTDIYALFMFEIIVVVLAIPITAVWRSLR